MFRHCQETLNISLPLSNRNNSSYFIPMNMSSFRSAEEFSSSFVGWRRGWLEKSHWRKGSNSSLGIVFLPVTVPPGPLVSTLPGGSEALLVAAFVSWLETKQDNSQGRKSLNLNILTIVHFEKKSRNSLIKKWSLHPLPSSVEPHSPLTVRTTLAWLVSTCPTYHKAILNKFNSIPTYIMALSKLQDGIKTGSKLCAHSLLEIYSRNS